MDERLGTSAKEGDIDTLYTLLSVDPLILEDLDHFPFSETPLHVAALYRKTSFLMEILNLKPSLIKKLNSDAYSPIHIACIEGHAEIVRELLDFDHKLGLLKGREWRTALHCAVINGRVEVVRNMLPSCTSDWLKALTVKKETVLHLAVKYSQIEVFSMLVDGVKDKSAEETVNWKDNEGNTILHLATYRRQFEIVDLMLRTNAFREVVDIDMKNSSGLTALDVLREHPINGPNTGEIENLLIQVGAARVQDIVVSVATHLPPHHSTLVEPLIVLEELFSGLPMEKWAKEIENSPTETRSTLMVVAVLIATVTFQVVLTPPGEFYTGFSYSFNRGWRRIPLFPVLVCIMNSVGFTASMVMITVLTRRFPLKALLRMAVLSMFGTYLSGLAFDTHSLVVVTLVTLPVFTILLLQWVHFKIRSLKQLFLS